MCGGDLCWRQMKRRKGSGSREGRKGQEQQGASISSANCSSGRREVKVGSRAGVLGQLRDNAVAPGAAENPLRGMGARRAGCCCSSAEPGGVGTASGLRPGSVALCPRCGRPATGEESGASPGGAGQVCLAAPCWGAPLGQPSSLLLLLLLLLPGRVPPRGAAARPGDVRVLGKGGRGGRG